MIQLDFKQKVYRRKREFFNKLKVIEGHIRLISFVAWKRFHDLFKNVSTHFHKEEYNLKGHIRHI